MGGPEERECPKAISAGPGPTKLPARHSIYHHVKKLMFTVRVDEPDPRFGNMMLEQFGGANGELAAAMICRWILVPGA